MTIKKSTKIPALLNIELPLFSDMRSDPAPRRPKSPKSKKGPVEKPAKAKKRGPRTTWPPAPKNLLQLKVKLLYTKPPIWRRVLVRDSRTFRDLHHLIQIVMGWDNEHMHAFRAYSTRRNDLSERSLLADIFTRKGAKIIYEYDFGDSWEHEIKLENVELYDPARPEPLCLAGERACPPEDCGGTPGYEAILNALRGPTDPESEELLEWVGEGFDPEAFDQDEVNRILRGGRRRR
jgi:hypothetical protein